MGQKQPGRPSPARKWSRPARCPEAARAHAGNDHRTSEPHSGTLADGESGDKEWRCQWVKLEHDEVDASGMVREAGAHRCDVASRRW
jgi:hypothetical protein